MKLIVGEKFGVLLFSIPFAWVILFFSDFESLFDCTSHVCTLCLLVAHGCGLFIQYTDFVDSMDEANYVGVSLPKPMGIVFEENDSEYGGIFVQSLTEDGVAAKCGSLQPGDQLVTVGTKNVSGLDFDDALAAIIESEDETTNLSLFRGSAKQFYGPTGPSKDWLTAFCEKGGVSLPPSPSTSSADEVPSESSAEEVSSS